MKDEKGRRGREDHEEGKVPARISTQRNTVAEEDEKADSTTEGYNKTDEDAAKKASTTTKKVSMVKVKQG